MRQPSGLRRLLSVGGPRRRAALRIDDQRAGRVPRRCVRSGVQTDEAVRVRIGGLARFERWTFAVGTPLAFALGWLRRRPSMVVVVPVTREVWRLWRRRLAVCVVGGCAGLAILAVGVGRGAAGSIVIGLLLVVWSNIMRVRWRLMRWVGLGLRPVDGTIILTRVHEEFESEARRLFVAGVTRR